MIYQQQRISIFSGVDIDILLRDKKVKKQEYRHRDTIICQPIDQVEFIEKTRPRRAQKVLDSSGKFLRQ